ncbi:MAG TPA: ABC transporter [Verrucomicrobia bacterium]|nr:MAG: ABC transporter [Lentisphaerae bacterium GWF2_57_35]HBA83771.1 ABC transporter [Verrucomicrobiota bacterium]
MIAWASWVGALPFDWAQFSFMQNALLAVVLVTPLFALLGCLVIQNQMAFFSDAIGHAALTGIALGVLLGIGNPLWSMIAFALLLALGITLLRRYSAVPTDTIISLMMAFTVALGVVLLSRGGGFANYSRFLIGDILTVSPSEIHGLGILLAVVVLLWTTLFNSFFLTFLNRSLAKSRGIRVWVLEGIFAAVVAVVVTVCIQWVGLLVINSLLILPAAAARNMAVGLRSYHLMALAISLVSGLAGLIFSFYWGTATGATIVLFAMAFFIVSLVFRKR